MNFTKNPHGNYIFFLFFWESWEFLGSWEKGMAGVSELFLL